MSEIELKACPFCGAKPETGPWQKHGLTVQCSSSLTDCPVCPGYSHYEPEGAVAAWNTRAPQWQPIESAPADELVVVCWLDDEDTENPERHEFDYIEDGMWVNHANLVEHAQAVAPPGSRVPKDHAPYQWWMPLPAPPEVEG
ncbi:Lar family restriction alleviation protein [Stenotrophomonas maltophilia]|nr:Lar family restriction alleviation protein [Stenotrophomonas maltophilia]